MEKRWWNWEQRNSSADRHHHHIHNRHPPLLLSRRASAPLNIMKRNEYQKTEGVVGTQENGISSGRDSAYGRQERPSFGLQCPPVSHAACHAMLLRFFPPGVLPCFCRCYYSFLWFSVCCLPCFCSVFVAVHMLPRRHVTFFLPFLPALAFRLLCFLVWWWMNREGIFSFFTPYHAIHQFSFHIY